MSGALDYPCPHAWCEGGAGAMCTNRKGQLAATTHRARIAKWTARGESYTRTPARQSSDSSSTGGQL